MTNSQYARIQYEQVYHLRRVLARAEKEGNKPMEEVALRLIRSRLAWDNTTTEKALLSYENRG